MSNDHDDSPLPSPTVSARPSAMPSDPPDTVVTEAPSDIVEAMNAAFLQEQNARPAPLPAPPAAASPVQVAPPRSAPRPISPPRSEPVPLAVPHSAAPLTPVGAPLTPRAPYSSTSDFRGGDEDVDPIAQTQAHELPAEAKAILDEVGPDEIETLASASAAAGRKPRSAPHAPAFAPAAQPAFAQPARPAEPSTPRRVSTPQAPDRMLVLVAVGVGSGLVVLILMGAAIFVFFRVLHPR